MFMHDFRELLVWKKSFSFTKSVYILTKEFPKEELFGLTSQLRRAAVSVVGNIAEGKGKNGDKDFLKFLYISRGSLNECETYLELAFSLGYIDQADYDSISRERGEVGFLLHKLIQSINK
jgi:four helix bundle protein